MSSRWLLAVFGVTLLTAGLWYSFSNQFRPEQATIQSGTGLRVTEALRGGSPEGFRRATEPRSFVFPADHGPHPGFRTEWWYFTGNLAATDGRRYGYQLTFFRVALAPEPVARKSRWGTHEVYMAHFALTDVAGKSFYHTERFSRSALGLAGAGGNPLKVWLEDWSAAAEALTPLTLRLHAREGTVAIDLGIRAVKSPVLNGDRGLSRKGTEPGNASYYYSLPRMATTGSIRIGTETVTVTGLTWMDREWGTSALGKELVGWDWFALQLDDGRDLMVYRLRKQDGTANPLDSATLVARDGMARHLSGNQVQVQVTDSWQSPASRIRYPSRWRVQVPGEHLDLEIEPRLAGQELLGTVRYWEGSVQVSGAGGGSTGGTGYVELTGYESPGSRPRNE
jgi:predicted secreted hydrolase